MDDKAFAKGMGIIMLVGCMAISFGLTLSLAATDEAAVIESSPPLTAEAEPVTVETPDLAPSEPDTDVIEALAKTVYGEAGICSTVEQAAVVWCVLNRVDAGMGDIMEVVTAPNQFEGYRATNPVEPEIAALVVDVLTRWQIEQTCIGSVGRVLPSDYLWFTGDGEHNYFRNDYNGSAYWDWSLPNPYEVTEQ